MQSNRRAAGGLWKRGDMWWANFKQNGRHIRKKLSRSKRTAEIMLRELRSQLDLAEAGLITNGVGWDDVKNTFLLWAQQSKAATTYEQYQRDVKAFEDFRTPQTVDQVTLQLVLDWRAHLTRQGDCPRTINRKVGTIHNMLARAAKPPSKRGFGLIAVNPIAGIEPLPHTEPKKVRRALTPAEVSAVLDAASDALRPALYLFLVTGIRKRELVELCFSDIDWDHHAIHIRPTNAKGGKPRTVPVDDAAMNMLRDLAEQAKARKPRRNARRGFSRDHVFVTSWNTPRRNNLLRDVRVILKRAGIEDHDTGGSLDLHALRSTYVTHALDGGANLKAVSQNVGHSNTRTTEKHYQKVTDRERRAVVAALPWAGEVSGGEGVVQMRKAK